MVEYIKLSNECVILFSQPVQQDFRFMAFNALWSHSNIHTYIRQSLFKKQLKNWQDQSPDVDLQYLDLCTWIFYLDERRAPKAQ